MTIIDNQRVFAATEIGTLYHNDERSISEKYGAFGAPYFKIEISNKDDNRLFSADSLLSQGGFDLNGLIVNDVSFDEDIDGAASITLTANNPTLELANSSLFDIGNNVDIWMGYDARTPFYMGRGIIVEIAPEFPASEMPTIRLTAYDISYFMMEEGKGEIVPEGSAWWERGRVRRTGRVVRQERANTSHPDSLTEEEREERAADNVRTRAYNVGSEEDVNYLAETTNAEEMADGVDVSLEEYNAVDIPPDDTPAEPTQIETRTGWQQQNLARRSRQAGKVWRNLTDAEIVAKIFLSYGITPYVEATGERTRRFSGRNRTRVVQATSDTIVDSTLGRLSDEEIARLEAEAAPDESLEETRDRLARDVESGETNYEDDTPADLIDSPENNDIFYRPSSNYNRGIFRQERPTEEDIAAQGFDPANVAGWDIEAGPFRIPYPELVDDTPPQMPTRTGAGGDRSVTQKAGTTDWDFLKELAAKHGFILFVFFHIDSRRWIGYWGPESNVPQFRQYIFRYNAGDLTTLGDVRPNVSAKGQATEIDLIFTDPRSRRENRLRVSMDNVNNYNSEFRGESGINPIGNPLGDGPEVTLAVHGQRVHVRANHMFTSAEDARIWLMAYWINHAEDFALLEGNTIVGIPELRAREHHIFEGLFRFSGTYFVTQARHYMSPGSMYCTEFTARRSSTLQPGDDNTDALTVDQKEIGSGTSDDSETSIVV